ncbi:hypothetical protein AMTR_s00068p00204290 [Amborella trichopoda]|uniref:Uncharacterized protein n=1 Tax=Amborella trichopoda TaxID=13333 RepID=U5DEC1_AMBTC|nr:hypothetical protein AMTR_s00068p00204290 [Amborella trichopoda]
MDDVITDFPPSSMLDFEDLNAFSPPPPPLPRPFILWSNTDPSDLNFHPKTLIVANPKPSCFFLHHVTCKTLIGTLVLPKIPVSEKTLEPSRSDNSCNIFKLDSSPEILPSCF